MRNSVLVTTTVEELWKGYGGGRKSGRFPCLVTVVICGEDIEVTHIYRGYGKTRLEWFAGQPPARKGFRGKDVTPISRCFLIRD